MRVSVALSALMLAACGQAETPAVETPVVETPAAPAVVEAPAPIVIGGVDLSQPLRAIGTEPFWGVEISPDELVYSGVDRPETKMVNPGPRLEGGDIVIAARDAADEAFTVTLSEAQCSDGMSDRVYPLEAEVLYKGETLKGCANSQAAMDAQPKP